MKPIIENIPFAAPSVDEQERQALLEVLRSGWLTTGNQALAFEKEFAQFTGSRYALAVNSATSGLHLALDALKVPSDSFVITTPYTFGATAEVIRYTGSHPLFVDIEEKTLNIDPCLVEQRLSSLGANKKKVKAIIPVHLGGHPCDMKAFRDISEKHKIPLIEDAAHTLPSKPDGRFLGTLGDVGVYSFYATKTMMTGEGGMVVTDDQGLANRMNIMRLHGIDRPAWDRYRKATGKSWDYDIIAPGYKYNMPDMCAAIGRVQLKKVESFWKRRSEIAQMYFNGLEECEHITLPEHAENHSWHLFIIRVKPEFPGTDRDRFMEKLIGQGIGVSVHYKPLHLMSYYRVTYNLIPEDFPISTKVFKQVISLPIYPNLTDEQVQRIISAVKGS